MREAICHWPATPCLPPAGGFVLVRVRTGLPRATARSRVRAVLRQVLVAWSGRSAEDLPLVEAAHGPVWRGLLKGASLELSLAYEEGEAWIALSRGTRIGVDVMRVQSAPDAALVTRAFLGPVATAELAQSRDPARDFALAWTRHEARCKCLRESLTEWRPPATRRSGRCATQSLIIEGTLALSIATEREERGVAKTA